MGIREILDVRRNPGGFEQEPWFSRHFFLTLLLCAEEGTSLPLFILLSPYCDDVIYILKHSQFPL
jgi:hypothetical protein